MQARMLPVPGWLALACVLAAVLLAATSTASQTASQTQQPEKQKKEETKKEETQEEQKGGGIFSGFRRLSGTSRTEEKQTTVTAGAKGAKPGVGKDIGNAEVASADRERVTHMEEAKPSAEEMTAFVQEGKLSPEQPGGGRL